MKLTKEECEKALESLKPMTIKEFREKEYLPFIGANRILTQLINEHFDNNMARTCQNLVSEIDKLEKEIEELKEKNTILNARVIDAYKK